MKLLQSLNLVLIWIWIILIQNIIKYIQRPLIEYKIACIVALVQHPITKELLFFFAGFLHSYNANDLTQMRLSDASTSREFG